MKSIFYRLAVALLYFDLLVVGVFLDVGVVVVNGLWCCFIQAFDTVVFRMSVLLYLGC